MRAKPFLVPLALAGLLAACQAGGPPAANQVGGGGTDTVRNQLDAMPEGQRNAVFIRAIRDAGQECQRVERSVRAGEQDGMPLWSAHCEGGPVYTIAIGFGGDAQVIVGEVAPPAGNAAAANVQGD